MKAACQLLVNINKAKLLIAIIIIVALVSANVVLAQANLVNDEAGMLTANQINSLEQELASASLRLHLQTIDNLGGAPIEAIAAKVYQERGLAGSDVLLLIASSEREVHLEATVGSSVDRAIMEAAQYDGSQQYSKFLDQAFIPYAIDGDFAEATLSVLRQLENLRATMDSGQVVLPATGTVPSNTAPSGENLPSAGAGSLSADSSSGIGGLLLLFIAVLAVIIAALFFKRKKIKQRKAALVAGYQAILNTVHAIEHDITPMVKLSQGKSQSYLKQLHNKFYNILQETSQLTDQIRGITIPLLASLNYNKQISDYEKQMQTYAETVEQIKQDLQAYKQMEVETAKLLKETKSSWQNADAKLQTLKKQLDYPLENLQKNSEEINAAIQQCDHAITFDPQSIAEVVKTLLEGTNSLEQEVQAVTQHTAELRTMPERLQTLRNSMQQLVQAESLILSEIEPFAFFENTDQALNKLQSALESGDTKTTAAVLKQLEDWMSDAQLQLKNTITARDWTNAEVLKAEQDLLKYDEQLINVLEQQLAELKNKYSANHWSDIPEQLVMVTEKKNILQAELQVVRDLASEKTQKYFAAEKSLQKVQVALQQLQATTDEILQRAQNLQQEQNKITGELDRYQSELSKVERRAQMISARNITDTVAQLRLALTEAQASLQKMPRDLQTSSALLTGLVANYTVLEQAIVRTEQEHERKKREQARIKREAELRRQRQVAATHSRTTNRTSSSSRGGSSSFPTASKGGSATFRSTGSRGGGSSFRSGGSRGGSSKW